MRRLSKRTGFAAAAAALAASGGGAAIAATQFDSPIERSDAIVSDAAKQLGVQPDALSAALKKAEENRIDADVSAGRLAKEQGDRLKSAIEAGRIPVLGVPVLGGRHRVLGPGFGFGVALDTAATYLGVTKDELRTDLRSGKTLADVARDKGKSVDGLVSALVDAAKKQLDRAVAAGKLTSDQEKSIESDLQQRITHVVNGTRPGPGIGFGLRGFAGPGSVAPGFGFRGHGLLPPDPGVA
jgi:hypothetical protein